MLRLILLAAVLLVLPRIGAGADEVFYVSPAGSDSWSGRLSSPNAGRSDGPLATLAGARDAVRKLKSGGALKAPVRIVVADGTYWLTEPFVLNTEDSGTTECPVVYEEAKGARPVFSGGRVISGWRPAEDGLWAAHVPDVAEGKWRFSQLFVNGRRRVRARTPNEGHFQIAGRAPMFAKSGIAEYDPLAVKFRPGDIKPWPDIDEANIVLLHYWESSRLKIASLDTEHSAVKFTGGDRLDWWLKLNPRPQFYVENVREALDAPGEWYLDYKTGNLCYHPMNGEDMRQAEVVAAVLPRLLVLAGDPDKGHCVEHVNLRGLTFSHAGWTLEPTGHGDPQAAVSVEAAVQADGVRHCTFSRCTVSHVGTYGVWFRRGCTDNRMDFCEIADTGAGGVRIGEPGIQRQENRRTARNTVYSCYIHGGGHVYPGAIGVWIGQSPSNTISHNEICDHQYSGISIGWTWGYTDSDTAGTITEYNHIHHLGQGILTDMGAIYNLGASPGSRIANNHIHDVWGGGIYPDEGSARLLIENNVAYRTLNGGLSLHYGKDNTVRNNIFALNYLDQVVRHRNEPHSAFTFERNIVYHDEGNLLRGGNNLDYEMLRHNVYWNSTGARDTFPGDRTFAEWQAAGRDIGSLYADPLFVDPKRGDFRLKPESPALKLGIRPIDTSQAGLVGDAAWVKAPRQVKRPPFKLSAPSYKKPQEIDDDFEGSLVGVPVDNAVTWGETAGAYVRVTDETAASGKHSLKFVDAPGLDYAFNPHVFYHPNLNDCVAVGGFDLRIEKGALFYYEWRDDHVPYRVGPSLSVDSEGNLLASGTKLLSIPLGEWVRFDITCGLGRHSSGTYSLQVGLPDGKTQSFTSLPCGKGFTRLNWLGFVSNANEKTVFYVDNVRIVKR